MKVIGHLREQHSACTYHVQEASWDLGVPPLPSALSSSSSLPARLPVHREKPLGLTQEVLPSCECGPVFSVWLCHALEMSSSSQGNFRSPETKTSGHSPPGSPRWSPEDVDKSLGASHLCDVCQVVFGLRNHWKVCPEYRQIFFKHYQHHTGRESLLCSLNNGCHMCAMVRRIWARNPRRGFERFQRSEFEFWGVPGFEGGSYLSLKAIHPGGSFEALFRFDPRESPSRCNLCPDNLIC